MSLEVVEIKALSATTSNVIELHVICADIMSFNFYSGYNSLLILIHDYMCWNSELTGHVTNISTKASWCFETPCKKNSVIKICEWAYKN